MKSRLPISLPNRADGTILPGALAAALLAALFAQLAWADAAPELPPVLAVTQARSAVFQPTPSSAPVPSVILDRPLFAPRQSNVNAADAAPPPILGGMTVAGTVSVRGRTFAVLRRPNGRAINLPVGSSVAGWRLRAIGEASATFVRGGERREIAFGNQPAQAAEEPAPQ